jgi:hypothetical protein
MNTNNDPKLAPARDVIDAEKQRQIEEMWDQYEYINNGNSYDDDENYIDL